jgi:transcriptional regulator with XRE-family HTH domain
MDHIGLKKLRKKLGLSLAQAAAKVHITPRTWARYEAGDRAIPESVVHLFCLQNKIKYPPD